MTLRHGGSVSFLAIIGLDFTPHTRTTSDDPIGIYLSGDGSDFLLENNKVDGYDDNVLVQARGGETLERVSIRRNIIVNSPVGVNLAEITYHSSQWVFKDIMLQSDEWRPQGGSTLALDSDGNITSLLLGQEAVTHVYLGLGDHYPAGEYTLFCEGEGEIQIDGSTLLSGGTVNVIPNNSGFVINLRTTDPNGTGNYIRKIRLIAPGEENGVTFTENYETQPFHPLFLATMEKFKTLRFMDWLETNNSQNVDLSHITPMIAATQGGARGAAPEYLALLANTLQADAWINIPHQATDAYVIEFATRLKDTLNPNLKLYVEYSNEVWNYGFDQAGYSRDRGYELGLDSSSGNMGEAQALLRYYSQRSVEIFHLFDQVFPGASNNQLVKVLGTQFASAWRSDTIMDWQDAYLEADVLAVAPYINTLRNEDGSRYTAVQLLAMG